MADSKSKEKAREKARERGERLPAKGSGSGVQRDEAAQPGPTEMDDAARRGGADR